MVSGAMHGRRSVIGTSVSGKQLTLEHTKDLESVGGMPSTVNL
jgi:hypothetical protein